MFDIQAGMIEHRTGGGSVALSKLVQDGVFLLSSAAGPQTGIFFTPLPLTLHARTHTLSSVNQLLAVSFILLLIIYKRFTLRVVPGKSKSNRLPVDLLFCEP